MQHALGSPTRNPDLLLLSGYGLVAIVAGSLSGLLEPVFVLAGAAAIAFAALCIMRPAVALLVLVAVGPLEGATAIGSEGGLSFTKLAGLLCFASLLLNLAVTDRRIFLEKSQVIVVAILGLALLSSLQARDVPAAFTTSLRYASFAMLFLIVTQFADDRRILRLIVWTLSISAAAAAGLGLFYYFSGALFVATLPFANPNDYAFMLATTLPLSIWLVRSQENKLLPAAIVALIATATLLSLSRGALLGLAAWTAWATVSARRRTATILAAAAVVGAAFFLAIWSDPGRFESGLELKEEVASKNVETRLAAWRGAVSLIGENPILGVGPGNFRIHFFEATGRPPGTENLFVVHNAYLDVATELGIVSGLLFIAYLWMQLDRASRMRREDRGDPPGLAGALQGALIVGTVSALTLSEQYFAPFWLLGAMVTCMWMSSTTADEVAR